MKLTMTTAIAATLFFSAITTGLAISRHVQGYRAFGDWPWLAAIIFNLGMILWLSYAAVWLFEHSQ